MFAIKSFICFCILLSGAMSYKKRLNIIESRLNMLEMRINIESNEIRIAKESIEVLNSSVSEFQERECLQGDGNIDRIEHNQESKNHSEAGTFTFKSNENRVLKAFKEQKAWSNAALSDLSSRINHCESKNADIQEQIKDIIGELGGVEQKTNQNKMQAESLKRNVVKLQERNIQQAEKLVAYQQMVDLFKDNVTDLKKENENLIATVNEQKNQIEDIRHEINKLHENQIKMMITTHCPVGWINFNIYCYIFKTKMISYEKAKAFCHRKGAYLVDIQSELENTFVSKLSRGLPTFLGMTNEAGQWTWDRTGEIATYTNWTPDAHQHSLKGHYAVIGFGSQQWKSWIYYYFWRVVCKRLP